MVGAVSFPFCPRKISFSFFRFVVIFTFSPGTSTLNLLFVYYFRGDLCIYISMYVTEG